MKETIFTVVLKLMGQPEKQSPAICLSKVTCLRPHAVAGIEPLTLGYESRTIPVTPPATPGSGHIAEQKKRENTEFMVGPALSF